MPVLYMCFEISLAEVSALARFSPAHVDRAKIAPFNFEYFIRTPQTNLVRFAGTGMAEDMLAGYLSERRRNHLNNFRHPTPPYRHITKTYHASVNENR